MKNQITLNLFKVFFSALYLFLFMFTINSESFFTDVKDINKERISYILRVEFPDFITKIPNLCAYYKGYAINFVDNICLIPQDNYINQLMLVITPEINHKSEGNNIKYLERIENKPCRIFYITSKLDKNNCVSWYCQEENIEDLPLRLPDGALVLLLNPNYVESLSYDEEYESFKNSSGTLINLPKIIIKQDVKIEEINNSMNYIWLAACDIRAIHSNLKTRLKKTCQNNQEIIVSIKLLER